MTVVINHDDPSLNNKKALTLFTRIRARAWRMLVHPLDALYDHGRYLRYSNSLRGSTNDPAKLETMLIFYYHKIEKALALPDVKPIFGLSYIGKLLDLLEKWANEVGDFAAVPFQAGYAALFHYREQVQDALAASQPVLLHRIDQVLAAYEPYVSGQSWGGAMPVTAAEITRDELWTSFADLVHSRHSVREFVAHRVPETEIEAAVGLAQRTPSVCNRQSWRVHVFSTAEDKQRILHYQNGNAGFGHLADRVLLLTADLRTFVSSGERNQAFTDGGMFAMSLIYALHARGIASCPLNLSLSFSADRALHQAAGIPAWETPIMMVAIGYPPPQLRVAVSARQAMAKILFFHGGKA